MQIRQEGIIYTQTLKIFFDLANPILARDERPEVLDRKGNWITDYKDGAALFRSFDQVTETFRERRMEPVKKAVEAVGKVVPKAPPVMAR